MSEEGMRTLPAGMGLGWTQTRRYHGIRRSSLLRLLMTSKHNVLARYVCFKKFSFRLECRFRAGEIMRGHDEGGSYYTEANLL